MSELQLYQQATGLSKLPKRESEIQIALSSKMIKDIQDPELFEIFKSNISKCYLISRFAAPEGIELTVIVDETMKMAKSRYGNLRVDEINIAFTRGLAKDYGDYMGLSFITFTDWIKFYLKEEVRINMTKPVPEIRKEPTREQKFDLAAYNAINAFTGFVKGKDISIQAPAVYRFLRKLGLFSYNEQEQTDFLIQAQKDIIAHLTEKKALVLDKIKRLEIARQLESPQTLEEKIIVHAQRLGLYAYFQAVIVEEADLKKLLAAKKQQVL